METSKHSIEKIKHSFDFGANLLILRKNKSLTQDELGPMVGVSGAQIGRYEKNKDVPGNAILLKLCDALGVSEVEIRGLSKRENLTSVKESPSTVFRMIPFWNAVTTGGFDIVGESTQVDRPTHMINPGTFFRNAEGALQISGHSMFPKYPSGCIVAYRLASLQLILWGEDYVVELTADRRLILKRIEKSAVAGCVKLVSYNVNKDSKYMYDPIDYPVNEINRVFMVIGKIELEAMQSI